MKPKIANFYAPEFIEILTRAKNDQPTTATERREMLAELFYLCIQTGTRFDNLTGRPLSWYNWAGISINIERLRTEYENQ